MDEEDEDGQDTSYGMMDDLQEEAERGRDQIIPNVEESEKEEGMDGERLRGWRRRGANGIKNGR